MKGFGSAQFDRRRYPRLDFTLPLAFKATADALIPDGVSGNVSLGGMMAFVTMLLPLGEEKKVCKAKAEVVWAQNGQFASGWVCQAGLRFVDMNSESNQIWRDFLKEWQGEKKIMPE